MLNIVNIMYLYRIHALYIIQTGRLFLMSECMLLSMCDAEVVPSTFDAQICMDAFGME